MPLCEQCDAVARQDLFSSEYVPMCVPCVALLKHGTENGYIVSNEDKRYGAHVECAVCRRVCCFMRVGDDRPMCWECYGWWKHCTRNDDYVGASVRLFERIDKMGLGHLVPSLGRRLLTRKEHRYSPNTVDDALTKSA